MLLSIWQAMSQHIEWVFPLLISTNAERGRAGRQGSRGNSLADFLPPPHTHGRGQHHARGWALPISPGAGALTGLPRPALVRVQAGRQAGSRSSHQAAPAPLQRNLVCLSYCTESITQARQHRHL